MAVRARIADDDKVALFQNRKKALDGEFIVVLTQRARNIID